MGLSRIPFCRK